MRLLTRLVTDFLNFARPQQLSLAPVALRELIDHCVHELHPQLSDSGIELYVDGEFDEVAAELARTLDHFGVPHKEKDAVLGAFFAHKYEVTTGYRAAVSTPA